MDFDRVRGVRAACSPEKLWRYEMCICLRVPLSPDPDTMLPLYPDVAKAGELEKEKKFYNVISIMLTIVMCIDDVSLMTLFE